ncbi:MAG: penicillin-binding protein 2 [Candidatus Omnitrophota bacterium]
MQLKIKPFRFSVVLIFFIGLLFIFLGRLIFIQFVRSSFLSNLAAKQHNFYIELEPQRGTIYDRNMKPVAVNVASYSLYAVPPDVKDKKKVARKLHELIGLEESFVLERLSRDKQFVWLVRKLDWQEMEKIKKQDMAGLAFIKESRRSYPNSRLASQLIGFAGLDNQGLDGLEKYYDDFLRGVSGWTFVLRDAKKRGLALSEAVEPPVDGYSLVLTIDQVVQYIAEREIDKVFEKYQAKGATIVVLDVKTGKILAMASRPTYDLNEPSKYAVEARRNRAVTDFFEPGSVFKIVTATAALDSSEFDLKDRIFCENGQYKVFSHTLHDVHPYGWLSFQDVIVQSSNIGTTKIAQKIGPECVYNYARRFGFGASTNAGLPGEVSGILKPVSCWSKTSISAVPIGQEVCVTALQLACAVSSIANGGIYMRPYILSAVIDRKGEVIKSFHPQAECRVMSVRTSRKMQQILEHVVERGTGKLAKSKQYKFAGKTGTAQKVESNGTYSHTKFMASFIGYAPADHPEIAIVVTVDEPKPYYYGGVVSAPAFKVVAEDVLKYLQLNLNTQDSDTYES